MKCANRNVISWNRIYKPITNCRTSFADYLSLIDIEYRIKMKKMEKEMITKYKLFAYYAD